MFGTIGTSERAYFKGLREYFETKKGEVFQGGSLALVPTS